MTRTERLFLVAALGLAILVRVMPVASAAGAVGDGGLFYAIVDDIRAGGLSLPDAIAYNGLNIPFVYPPLSLWTAAAIAQATGLATLDVVAWMPVVASIATVGAFAWLAWRALPPSAAVGATLTYSLMPHAYDWVIAGGGLTRSVGLLFALVAMALAAERARASHRTAAATGVFLGLAALSHPQAAVFGVVGCVILSWRPPIRMWISRLATAAGITVVVVLPLLLMVASAHGLDALLGAGHRLDVGTGLIRMLNLRFSGAPFMDLFATVAVVGLFASLVSRAWQVPTLLLLTYMVGAGGGEFLGAVPWAILGGVGFRALIELADGSMRRFRPRSARIAGAAIASLVLFLALIASVGSLADRSSKLQALSADHIAAMNWVRTNTDPSAFAIVATTDVWGDDEVSEWFPALAERSSIGTVQGSEWLGADAFRQQLQRHLAILACAGSTADCYAEVDPKALIFVPKGRLAGPFSPADCCPALRTTLPDAGYEVIYDGPGATIAQPGG